MHHACLNTRSQTTTFFFCSHFGLSLILTPTPDPLGSLPPPHMLTSVPITDPATVRNPQLGADATNAQVSGATGPTPQPSSALILSSAAAPVPSKLVDKIRSGQFVEMRKLLNNNILLMQQIEELQGSTPVATVGPNRPHLREVTKLPTWLHCFLAYAAVLKTDPNTRDMLAYARLIIQEALRHRNTGWLDYDRAFRQQVAANPLIPWNTLLPALQATKILGNTSRFGSRTPRLQCNLCNGADHSRYDCALAYLHLPPSRPQPQRRTYPTPNICTSWNKGTPTHARTAMFVQHAPAHNHILSKHPCRLRV